VTGFDPQNITHVYLRRIDQKLDRVLDDVNDLKVRITSVEESLVGVQRRVDRLEMRVERIEHRLDLRDDAFAEATESFEGPKK
jgi:archaellum component FlaC